MVNILREFDFEEFKWGWSQKKNEVFQVVQQEGSLGINDNSEISE